MFTYSCMEVSEIWCCSRGESKELDENLATLSLRLSFMIDKVGAAIKKVKWRKAPVPDNLMAEHLLEGGVAVIKWFTECCGPP